MPLLTTRSKIVPSVADPREIVEGDPGNDDEKDKDPVREGPPIVPEVPNTHKVKGSDKNTRFSHTFHPFHKSNKGQSDGHDRPLRVLGDTATEPEEASKTKPEDASKAKPEEAAKTKPEDAAKTEPEEKVEGDVGTKPDSAKAPETPSGKTHSAKEPKQSTTNEDPFSPAPSMEVGRSAMPRDEPEMEEVPVYHRITLPDGSKALIPMGTAKVPSTRPTPVPSRGSSSAPGDSKGKAAAATPLAEKDDTPDQAAGSADKTKKPPSGPAPLHDLHNMPTEKEASDKPGTSKDHATPEEITEANLPKDHAKASKEPSVASKPPAGASKAPADGSKPGAGKSDDSPTKPPAGDSADDASKPPPVPKPPRTLPSLPTEPSGTFTVPPEREKEPWEIASPAATMPPANVTPAPSMNKIKRKPVAKEDDAQPQTLGDKPTDDTAPADKDKAPGSGGAGEKGPMAKDKPLPPPGTSGPAGGKPESEKAKPHREPPAPPGSTPPAADPPGHIHCHCERCCTNPPRVGYHDMATSAATPEPAPAKELAAKDASSKEAGPKASEAKDATGKDAAAKDTAAKEPTPPPKTPSPPPPVPLSHQIAPVHPDHPTFSPVPFPDITGPYANVPLPKPSPPPAEDASKKQPGKEKGKEKDPKESGGKEAEAEASTAEDKATKKPEDKEPVPPNSSKAGSSKSNQSDGSKGKSGKDKSDDGLAPQETLVGLSTLAGRSRLHDTTDIKATAKLASAQTEGDGEKQVAADRHKEVIERITGIEKTLVGSRSEAFTNTFRNPSSTTTKNGAPRTRRSTKSF